jgi:hypothetical protein
MFFNISKSVLIVSLSFFVAVVLLDPSAKILHLKLPLFIFVFSVWAIRVACRMVNPGSLKTCAAILLFSFVIPGIATIVGLLGDTLPAGEFHFATLNSFALLLLIPIVSSEGIDLTKHIIRWSFIIAVLTIAMAVLSFVAPLFFSVVTEFTLAKENAFVSPRDMLGVGVGSYYYASAAVLVLPIAYYLRNLLDCRRKIISFLFFVLFSAAVLCSGSRATALGSFAVVIVLILQKIKTIIGPGTALLVLLVIVAFGGSYIFSYFDSKEESNAIKVGHARSYVEEFSAHPSYLIWGQGADTEFYSTALDAKTNKTELSYIELIRQFGIPVTFVFVIALVYPMFELGRRASSTSYLALPYGVFLFEAGTNPILIGSTGLLVVCSIWGVVLMHKVQKTVAAPMEALR